MPYFQLDRTLPFLYRCKRYHFFAKWNLFSTIRSRYIIKKINGIARSIALLPRRCCCR
jgi:hypothetical protein